MNIKMRHLFIVCITLFFMVIPLSGNAVFPDPDMVDYTAYPPFTISAVEPNILLVLDMSGSMQFPAYLGCTMSGYDNKRANCGSSSSASYLYDPAREDGYYGYFKKDKYYRLGTNKFDEDATCNDKFDDNIGDANCISGNLLNWVTMSRIDLLRKVLIGGKSASTQGNTHTLRGEGGWWTYSDSNLHCTFTVANGSASNLDHDMTVTDYGGACAIGTFANYNIKVDVPENERRGIVHQLSDKDYDGTWDIDSPRFGLMIFANDSRKGEMKVGIEGANMSSFLTALQSEVPYDGTPTGEALEEAYDYYSQTDKHVHEANSAYIGGPGSLQDPLCDNKKMIGCRKNFVLLISDGEWNVDIDPVRPARENFINDIRGDIDGFQNIITYAVHTFGDSALGLNSLRQVAMFGDFEDYDGSTWPYDRTAYPADSRNAILPAAPCDPAGVVDVYCKEWDAGAPPDGYPDNFYDASDGTELESKLIEAITDMLRRASSGTAVSVLATSGEGEGAVYQAYFFPEKLEGVEKRRWLGYVQALFVDKYGNLREDTNGNKSLDTTDKILLFSYASNKGTKVYKCSDTNLDGKVDTCPPTPDDFDNIAAIWRGGKLLWATAPDERRIFTTVDGFTYLNFTDANSATLLPYIRATVADPNEANNMINWVRGDDLTNITDTGHPDGYRKRSITDPPLSGITNVWKLGDIIHSTPITVGRPAENFDLVYNDQSYASFRADYIQRRQVVYVGSNDGMLHAFNAGCYDSAAHKFYPDVDATGSCTSGGSRSLGDELWAFIPRTLLPHLKWLTDPDYTHVYYVDLEPYVTDAKIFSSGTHTKGWGTILIGGLRYGGKDISWTSGVTDYSRSPEYFALDITEPLSPRVLWSFSDPDIGLTMSHPTLVKVGTDWFAIFGSGATDFNTSSNLTTFQAGNIFVLKISGGNDGVIDSWTEGTNFWKIPTGNATTFMAHPITLDVNSDFDDDVIYMGENYRNNSGKWNALMRRITTNEGTQSDPALWGLSTLGDVDDMDGNGNLDIIKRITAPATASMDNKGKLWVFFGTGQFLGTADKNQTDTGAFYAIKDSCWRGNCTDSYGSADLLNVSGATVKTDGTVTGVSGTCASGSTSTWSNLLSGSSSCDGWSIFFGSPGIEGTDFTGTALNHAGERVTAAPLVFGGLVTWASYIPGIEECSEEGESNLYAVFYKTGTAFDEYVFTEQKNQAAPSPTVGRTKNLGAGMPSAVSAQITDSGTVKGFAQQSTGSIAQLEQNPATSVRSGLHGWIPEPLQ